MKALALEHMVSNEQVEKEQLQHRLQQLASVDEVLRSREDTSTSSALSQAEVTQYTLAYADDANQLQKFLERHQLRKADPLGKPSLPGLSMPAPARACSWMSPKCLCVAAAVLRQVWQGL